ncbi:alpha/beta hydrolase [Streptomyces mirabilis]|nr:alpha/beta hydrolase [Streptomyces mirabilis]
MLHHRPRPAGGDHRLAAPGELAGAAGAAAALVIVDDSDVLRDEGEAYARRLTQADVPTTSIRINGTLHDFMMLNPLRTTQATTAAVETAIHTLRTALRGN